MKTAVSVPDAIFRRADRLARRMQKSRSQIYTEALRAFLLLHEPQELTEAVDAALAKAGCEPDDLARRAARRTLRKTEW